MFGKGVFQEEESLLREIIRSIDKRLDYSAKEARVRASRCASKLRNHEADVVLDMQYLNPAKADTVGRHQIRQKINARCDHLDKSRYGDDVLVLDRRGSSRRAKTASSRASPRIRQGDQGDSRVHCWSAWRGNMGKGQLVRDVLARDGQIVMPGVYDALSAKIAIRAGFDVIFITGYSLSATLLGEPDFGLLTQTEVVSAAQRICSVVSAPVIVDADTGYGNSINVIRTVEELLRAGAAGMFLEDQVWPKRCGHMQGKQVIPLEEHLKKIKAAVDAKGDGDFFIVARTDARQALGLAEAIERGIAFSEAGADAVFIEAPESKEEMNEIARRVPGPLVANMLERGVTPLMNPGELKNLGFELVVWPLAPLYAAAKSLTTVYQTLRRDGSTLAILDQLTAFDEFNEIVGLDKKYALDQRYRA